MILDSIKKENDIKAVDPKDYDALAGEIRRFIIEKVSVTGGHLAPSLGVVELTMALHLAFTLPQDKLVWDVGHQSYAHKILTGRKEGFDTLRKFGGMSGFPKVSESPCDVFDTGHSSNSISVALGMAKARDLMGRKNYVAAIIGDGALTGGMAFEALNNAAKVERNLIIILNDNSFSISENVGGMSRYLNSIRTTEAYLGLKEEVYHTLSDIPKYGAPIVAGIRRAKNTFKQMVIHGMLFENLGVTYLGPVDGHNIDQMLSAINEAKRVRGPVLVHVKTQKGRGYEPAYRHPDRFHGTAPFEIETGLLKSQKLKPDYSDVFSANILKLAAERRDIVAVTAAMHDGVGLKRFRMKYPDRFVDVGIAEAHAVTYCGGLAAGGVRPVFAVYSSFLQRGYDQVMEDVCLQKLPVVFAIDRAGLVGSDGETHQGVFDISYLSAMPGMTVMAPKNKWELGDMLRFAIELSAPAAVRYPRGQAYDGLKEHRSPIELGKPELIYSGSEVCILALGNMVEVAVEVREYLQKRGISPTLVNARFAKPLDEAALKACTKDHRLIVTMEDNVYTGGFGSGVREILNTPDILSIAIPDEFVPHGSIPELRRMLGMDGESVAERILERLNNI